MEEMAELVERVSLLNLLGLGFKKMEINKLEIKKREIKSL